MIEKTTKTNAVILAGGQGTRLAPYLKNLPKALVKIGDKSVIEHQIALLASHGITDIWVLLGYLGEQIKKDLGSGKKLGVQINYLQELRPLGTAGALKQLEGKIEEDFIVLSGDILLNLDFQKFVSWHQKKENPIASFVVHQTDHPQDSDLISVSDNDQIKSLFIRPHSKRKELPNLSIASVFMFSPRIFQYIDFDKKCDIEKEILPEILKKDQNVFAYNAREYIKDMGTIERLEQVKKDYVLGKIYVS